MCCMYQSICLLPAGTFSDMVIATIDMGISILRGGNTDVQAVSRAPCLTFMCCPLVKCLVCFQACLLGGTTYNSVPIVCHVCIVHTSLLVMKPNINIDCFKYGLCD